MKEIKLLECTLRDGTYAVDFMIDPDTFYSFTEALINCGFQDIEIGHGLGLGAYRSYSADFTDEEVWKRLQPLTVKARLYSFFIPYVGTLDDIRIAREYGLYGLRIGSEPSSIDQHIKAIEEAKKLGYFVALNLMKSYTVTPAGFAQIVDTYKDLVDVIYIVDSAGHMLPSELRNYVDAIHERVGMFNLGYHGHNNLGLGVANALELIDAGVEYIDTTLTGIGRSGGNVPTETMIAVLSKKFGDTQFSDKFLLDTMSVARRFREYILSKGKNFDIRSEDILFGHSGFHSSYETLLRDYTEEKGIDFYQAIIDVSKHEKGRLSIEILDQILHKM
ncbi:MAG: 4-hydroxy-2-oxovalerate aldolase [Gammaproteobacteria bacterium]|nr:4-hydroxy-2-oxovalerate aldolase [Gammaproteobacteria bacterium]